MRLLVLFLLACNGRSGSIVIDKSENIDFGDADGDGYSDEDGDCNDGDASINPAAEELCDEIDNNCDGEIDEDVTTTYYFDSDEDGYGNVDIPMDACEQPEGYVEDDSDCDDRDPAMIIKFEKKLHEHLMLEKQTPQIESFHTPDVDRLVLKIMKEKVQEKYGGVLTTEQSDLLRDYVLFADKSPEKLSTKLEGIKESTRKALALYADDCDSSLVSKNIQEVATKVDSLRTSSPDDPLISQYLTVMKLTNEIGAQ